MLHRYKIESAEIAKNIFHLKDEMQIDSFRHGWASADITYKYGSLITRVLSGLNEYLSILCPIKYTNMDLWNNNVGRKIGLEAKKMGISREKLAEKVKEAFDNNVLIVDPETDTRQYKSTLFSIFKFIQEKIGLIKK